MKKRNPWGQMAPQNAREITFVKLASGKMVPAEEVSDAQWRASGFTRDPVTGKLDVIQSGWEGVSNKLTGEAFIKAQNDLLDKLEPILLGLPMDLVVTTFIQQALDQIGQIEDPGVRHSASDAVRKLLSRQFPDDLPAPTMVQ